MLTNVHNSLNIRERYNLIKEWEGTHQPHHKALTNWRSEMSILSDEDFNEMLKLNHYDKNIFSLAVEKNPDEELINLYKHKVLNSLWYQQFSEIIENLDEGRILNKENAGLLFILRPFIDFVYKETTELSSHENYYSNFSENTIKEMVEQFAVSILEIAQKSIILELNLDRDNNKLIGETSEDRFLSFISQYKSKKKLISFYDKYIVLTRILTTITFNFLENIKNLFLRIRKHESQILEKFNIEPPLLLTKMKIGQGDTHNKGNTVIELTFNDVHKVVYKPKNIELSTTYNKIISYFNNNENILEMKTIQGLYTKHYAFEEYISYEGCTEENQFSKYYQRFGQLIGVLYLLNASDIHMENLIANGEHPIVIDLETLFQQPITHAIENDSIFQESFLRIFQNVTSTMLLPYNAPSDREDIVGMDLSALDGKGIKINKKILQPINVGTDQMRYEYLEFSTTDSNNIPYLENSNKKIGYKNFVNELLKGFRNICDIALNNKDDLISIINSAENKIVRVIVRDTSQYGNILQHSNHPDLLEDMLDREKVFENMWGHPFKDKEIIKYEVQDMLINDIPIFFNQIGTRNILSSDFKLKKPIQNYNGQELVLNKINNLTVEEIQKQISVINISLGFYPQKEHIEDSCKLITSDSLVNIDLKEMASNIADSMIENAIVSDDKIMWITINPELEDSWAVGMVNDDFYDGLSGIYLFFQTLYKETKNEKYLSYANKVINTVNHNILKNELGLTSGLVGIIHAASKMKTQKLPRELKSLLKTQVNYIDTNDFSINNVDYLNGPTSLINSLLSIYKNTKDTSYLSLAIKFAEKFIVIPDKEELKNDLSFGHGSISTALVFFRLWKCTNNSRYYKYGEIFYKEFHSNFKNQYDQESLRLNFSWCRGIVGILIAEIEIRSLLSLSDESKVIQSLEPLLFNMDMLKDDGICHGNIAVTEYFLKKYEYNQNEEDVQIARNIVANVVKRANNKNKFMLRSTEGFESIGLFTGLAGIGYQLLRVHNADSIKSIVD